MLAMVLRAARSPLELMERPNPPLRPGQVRVRVEACAVCRTDLHVQAGELPDVPHPIVPGHQAVGIVEEVSGGTRLKVGDRVGLPWLGSTCGVCPYCRGGRENLCDAPTFNGYTRDGGFAEYAVAEADFAIPLERTDDPIATAPLLCAGLIGWRSLLATGTAQTLSIFGFGAAAHLLAQICTSQGRTVYAFTRPGDTPAQGFARELGAAWAGSSNEAPPKPADAAIIFAPAGELVPRALATVRKGGVVVCGGIHMTDIPAFPYRLLWEERRLVSIANLTRDDATSFFPAARRAGVRARTHTYPLRAANEALNDLAAGRIHGTAVLVP